MACKVETFSCERFMTRIGRVPLRQGETIVVVDPGPGDGGKSRPTGAKKAAGTKKGAGARKR